MRKLLATLLAAVFLPVSAAVINFEWDAGPDYPPGVTYELYGNSESASGISGTTYGLDIPGSPGEPLSARVRAVPPAGAQCGDPPEDCQPSDYATLETVIPGLAAITPEEQYGLCATREISEHGMAVSLSHQNENNVGGASSLTTTATVASGDTYAIAIVHVD